MTPARCCVLLLIATFAALALRLPRLEQRPMHGDEAVQAYKFGELFDEHRYQYDRREYHGPTLPYLTLIPARLSRAGTFVDLSEFTLRIVPVFFGVLLVLGLWGLRDGLGRVPLVFAAFLSALSPAMVYYSRYYIHEMLLVFFTFGALLCGYRYLRSQKVVWAVWAGAFLGLMHATKETCVLAFASLGLACLVFLFTRDPKAGPIMTYLKRLRPSHLGWAALAAVAVSVVFYSSFFTNPQGVLDSIFTYETYLKRGSGHSLHNHPWSFYLGLLSFYQYADGPIFSEALILILALVGFGVALSRKNAAGADQGLLRFLAVYTLAMTVLYCMVPYKTPWCLLGFLHGMILLAGVGAAHLIQCRPRMLGLSLAGLLVLGMAHLGVQAYSSSFKYSADSRNPYVYAHTSPDIFAIVKGVEQVAAVHEDGSNMRIQVMCPDGDYWPLPWYLRGRLVAYTSEVPEQTPPAPVILIQPSLEPGLMRVLYELPEPGKKELYMYLFYEDGRPLSLELRPQVELRGFVAKSLWDRLQDAKASGAIQPTAPGGEP